jgi:hypothetical protein
MYYTAVQDLELSSAALGDSNYNTQTSTDFDSLKLAKLIHLRADVGFAGITEFHCRAILGACWDPMAASYPGQYNIPQCYEEATISDGTKTLNLYDPQLFKPIVPAQFRAVEGECDTNYFHISTLYYERRACTYDIEMIKYGTDYSPLAEPTREDCLFRLGCCYEDNEEVMAKYPFMPRCYQRVKDDKLEQRLFTTNPLTDEDGHICGARVGSFISKVARLATFEFSQAVNAYEIQYLDANAETKTYELKSAQDIYNMNDDNICMYINTNTRHTPTECVDQDNCVFWQTFDLFDKETAKEFYKKFDGIPEELQGMVNDLF